MIQKYKIDMDILLQCIKQEMVKYQLKNGAIINI